MLARSYHDPDRNLDGYKTFAFDYASKNDPLLEKELFKALRRSCFATWCSVTSRGADLTGLCQPVARTAD